MSWCVAGLVACAVLLGMPGLPGGSRLPVEPERSAAEPSPGPGWMVRYRVVWAGLAGLGAALFVAGPAGPVAGLLAAAVTWVGIGRAEPADVRRRREQVRRDLPMS